MLIGKERWKGRAEMVVHWGTCKCLVSEEKNEEWISIMVLVWGRIMRDFWLMTACYYYLRTSQHTTLFLIL